MSEGRWKGWNMKFIYSLLVVLILSSRLDAYDAAPRCYKSFATQFFQQTLVMQALSLQLIPQNTWSLIVRDLNSRSQEIWSTIDREARRMNPNPFRNPFNQKEAQRLMENALWDQFFTVVQSYSVYDTYRIRNAFEYIMAQQKQNFEECLHQRGRRGH